MSERDYLENHSILPKLEGRRCFLTLAASTVKLQIDKRQKGGTYIWIAPPWKLTQNGETIATSASYPDHEAKNYQEQHDKWCSQFDDLSESRILTIGSTKEGTLRIELERGFVIKVPADSYQSAEIDDWYDHWYVRDGTEDCA